MDAEIPPDSPAGGGASRLLRMFGVVVLVVGGAGYGATEYINSTMSTATPPSPYVTQPPSPDCTQGNAVQCPLPVGDDCPPREGGEAARQWARTVLESVPPPSPGGPPPTGDPWTETRFCAVSVVVVRAK